MSTHIFLQRRFEQPVSVDEVRERARGDEWCHLVHKVQWRGSFLSRDGHTLVCWFTAADAESIRIAVRQSGADTQFLWAGTVHEEESPPPVPNALVERSFPDPVTFEEVHAIAKAARGCLQIHRVKYSRSFFSADHKRMLCLYQAPDTESVRIIQREAGLPADSVWALQTIAPL
jgi:hypothetical protein